MRLHLAMHRHRHDEGSPNLYTFLLSDDHPLIDEDYVMNNSDGDFSELDRDDEEIVILDPIPIDVPLLNRLEGLAIIANNQTFSVRDILEKVTDDDLQLAISDMAEALIQEGVL